jgi:ATP-dependent protease ClpP protease subunit
MKTKLIKIPQRFKVQNSADGGSKDLFLYGTIGGWWSEITASNVLRQLSSISEKTVNVHIHSGGGDVFESIAIYNIFKSSDKVINIYIDGLAASGASLIAMAGDAIFMPRNTMMMIHRAWTYAQGNANQLLKLSQDLAKMDGAVEESYKARFTGTDENITELLDNTTWLKADECVELGLADQVIDPVEIPNDDSEEDDDQENASNSTGIAAASSSIPGFASVPENWAKALNASSIYPDDAPAPAFNIDDQVGLTIPPHMPGHTTGTVREAVLTYAYGIVFKGMEDDGIHHWYTESELKAASSGEGEEDDPAANKNNAQQNPNGDNMPNMSFANKFAQALVLANQKLNGKE